MPNDATKKTKWARNLLLIVGGILILSVISFFAIKSHKQSNTLVVNNAHIQIEFAKTQQQKARGLCCRDSLPKNSGMLFIYDQPGNYRFWMKNTRIPLDMYWINQENKIVHIEKNVKPETYPKSFGTDIPAQYILETNAGFADTHGIKPGDNVQF